jgi:hypothetical protein
MKALNGTTFWSRDFQGDARVRSIRFETEAPLDDILVETDASGWIFAQAKTALSLSENLDTEFGKTVEQIVRQWRTCVAGTGERGWDRKLVPGRDRMLIAVGPNASGTITGDLAIALTSMQAPSAAASQAQQQALVGRSNSASCGISFESAAT